MPPRPRTAPHHRRPPRRVGILIFDDVEVLDFAGPFEVFATARSDGEAGADERLFEVVTIAEEERLVRCTGGLHVQPQHTLAAHPALDILVVPGGAGTRRLRENSRLLDWIAAQDRRTELTTSVCTGAFLLAERGILDGLQATTHWSSVAWMRDQYPRIELLDAVRVVDTGHVVTAAGVSAGIDMALHVVARLHGAAAAAWTARRMEYEWAEQYRSIFAASRDAIVITDPEGRIVEANAAASQLFGYAHAELLGWQAATLVRPDDATVVAQSLQAVHAEGSVAARWVCHRHDGTPFHAEGRGTVFVYQGAPRVLWLLRDVSERVAAEQAVQAERQRLARELHDSVSQALYSIALATKTARALLEQDPARAHEPLGFATAQAETGLAEMRALIFALLPEVLETEGLVAALEKQVAALRARYGVTITATLDAEPDVPLAVKEALYRIAQEALHNTVKHAQARTVEVRLKAGAAALVLEVCDDGVGFQTAGTYPGHLGQHTMRERAARLGGKLEVVSTPGAGTRVRAQIPGRSPAQNPTSLAMHP